jgi:predicted transcriptional regulator
MQRRSWPQITTDILEVTLRPANKMKVMYRSNLNFERFNRYFYDLIKKGFIQEANGSYGKEKFQITERGKTLLDVLKKAQDLFFSEDY